LFTIILVVMIMIVIVITAAAMTGSNDRGSSAPPDLVCDGGARTLSRVPRPGPAVVMAVESAAARPIVCSGCGNSFQKRDIIRIDLVDSTISSSVSSSLSAFVSKIKQ
jgi:hypothetical protein